MRRRLGHDSKAIVQGEAAAAGSPLPVESSERDMTRTANRDELTGEFSPAHQSLQVTHQSSKNYHRRAEDQRESASER